jgi:hypothetical protein
LMKVYRKLRKVSYSATSHFQELRLAPQSRCHHLTIPAVFRVTKFRRTPPFFFATLWEQFFIPPNSSRNDRRMISRMCQCYTPRSTPSMMIGKKQGRKSETGELWESWSEGFASRSYQNESVRVSEQEFFKFPNRKEMDAFAIITYWPISLAMCKQPHHSSCLLGSRGNCLMAWAWMEDALSGSKYLSSM